MTEWQWTILLFASLAANTAENRNIIAEVFANNGSGETVVDERKAFQNAARLVQASSPTIVVARAISSPLKKEIRDELEIAINTINEGLSPQNELRWYLIAGIDLANFDKGQLIQSSESSVSDRIGTQFTWQDSLEDLSIVEIEE